MKKVSHDFLSELVIDMDKDFKLSTMSWCQSKKDCGLDFLNAAFELELLLVLQGATAPLVTKEQLQHFPIILALNFYSFCENKHSFSNISILFSIFHASSIDNI